MLLYNLYCLTYTSSYTILYRRRSRRILCSSTACLSITYLWHKTTSLFIAQS